MLSTSTRRAAAPVEPALFREGMSRVASAVHVVTVGGASGEAGVTATAVCSVTDSPSSLLVCLHNNGQVRKLMRVGDPLAVNTLRADQQHIAAVFAGQGGLAMSERFQSGCWEFEPGQAPRLLDALTTFRCAVEDVWARGTHSIITCRVVEILLHDGSEGLVYGGRRYTSVQVS